jgi:tetratricopeptide (TPR) repeat protein
VIALALAVALAAADPAARFAEANARLEAGDPDGAARLYEALLADGLESPALHANLGAARLRAGRRGPAVASFERALRLDPRDEDARADLAVARGRSAGGVDRPFLARVVERTPDAWAAAAFAAPWATLFVLLAVARRARARRRALLRLGAALAAVLAALGASLLAGRVAERGAAVAIVVAAEAPLREGPEEALRPSLRLPEGTAIRLLETRGGAARVRLASGAEGWVRTSDLEPL